jgi:predicted TIM-barrel fold metal-dependent hydrolase
MIHPIERSLTSLVIGGVFEKFSRLKIVSAENDVAWIPFFLFRIDKYAARGIQSKKLPLKPSEYIKRQVYATFIDDPVFVNLLDWYPSDNIMWSSDYPQWAGDSPAFAGLCRAPSEQSTRDRPAEDCARYRG